MRPECRERFPSRSTSKETDSQRSRHASRPVRDARAVMHVGSLTRGGGENVLGIPAHAHPQVYLSDKRPVPDALSTRMLIVPVYTGCLLYVFHIDTRVY